MRKSKVKLSANERSLILVLYRLGATDAEVADALKIPRTTFLYNLKKIPGFIDTIKKEKSIPDKNVEKKLYLRAMGFEYQEKIEKNTGEKEVRTKYALPDVAAAFIWLKNRVPEKWRDTHHLETKNTNSEGIQDFSARELARIAAGEDPRKILEERDNN